MKVYAHRGYSGKYPENTMLAFRKAIEVGADGVEMDVQLSKDGEVVVIHDETLDRTTTGKGYVKDYALAEMKQFNAAKGREDQFGFQEIPSFDEFCIWLKETHAIANIELKSSIIYYPELESKCLEIIRRYNLEKQVIISSFNHMSLVRVQQLAPEIPLGALVEREGLMNAGYYGKQFGFKYYHPDFCLLNEEAVKECKRNGVGINVWTVNDLAAFEQLMEWNVDGIITNFPQIPYHWQENHSNPDKT